MLGTLRCNVDAGVLWMPGLPGQNMSSLFEWLNHLNLSLITENGSTTFMATYALEAV